jgi:hypothetical protein
MTAIAGAALGLMAAVLSGLAASRRMLAGLSRAEKAAWGLAVGLLLQAALCLLLALARPGADFTLPLAVLSTLLILPVLRRSSATETALPPPSGSPFAVKWILVAAAAGVALFSVVALSEPMWVPDYLAVWGLKAKTIFLTASVPGRLFHDPETLWSHPEYPLLLPLDLAALSTWARGWDDRAPALLYPICQAATALAAFGFLRRRGRAVGGAVAAALIAWFFPLYAPEHVGLADIPLALGFVLVGTALLDAFETDTPAVRTRLAAAALFCAALKPEGSLFAVLAALVWLARRPRGRAAATVAGALAAPVFLHAAALRLARGPIASRDFDLGFLQPARWGQWLGRVGVTVGEITRADIAAAAVPLAALAVFFLVTRRGLADPLGHLLAGQAALYVLAVSLCAFGPAFLVETAFARIVCALFPVLALVLGARVGRDEALPP